ncbi:unnamed protein product [Urochloa decumbens]|uniref:Uncharacterized protein n=1 Tax=Urochloa decumbens TaxID=240449 RepID=A0ABC9D7T5_9POAL
MLDGLAVAGLQIPVPAPQHDPAVVPRPLHDRQHLRHQRRRRHVPAPRGARRRGQPQVHGAPWQASRPGVPRAGERRHVPGTVAADGVVVELDVNSVEEPRPQRLPQHPVRERALGRRRDPHLLLALFAVTLQVPREVVVVLGSPVLDVEVDAVEHGVAEWPDLGVAAQVDVPDVVGHGLGVGLGCEGVPAQAAADGEEDKDLLGLAVLDVRADRAPGVSGEVELVGAAAEVGQKGEDDGGVEVARARLVEAALAGRLAPVHGDPASLARCRCRAEAREEHDAADGS